MVRVGMEGGRDSGRERGRGEEGGVGIGVRTQAAFER